MLINNKNLDLVGEGSKQETRQGRDRRGNKNKVLGGPLELRLRLKVGAVCLRDAKGVTGHDARLRLSTDDGLLSTLGPARLRVTGRACRGDL